jgi:hypothetical protein
VIVIEITRPPTCCQILKLLEFESANPKVCFGINLAGLYRASALLIPP